MKRAFYPAMILCLWLAPTTGMAAADIGTLPPLSVGATLVGLSDLTAADKRRLDFYASKIVDEIKAVTTLEDDGEADGAAAKLTEAREMAVRFTASAELVGLTPAEAREYFLAQFVANFSGRVPSVLAGNGGIFDLSGLFATPETDTAQPAIQGDYLDQLRDQTQQAIGNGN